MPINQLFIKKPERELVEKLVNTYGLTGFEDETVFSKRKFEKNDTKEKFEEIVEQLREFYLPCKRKIYLDNITHKKAVTIMRQCLRLYNFYIRSKEKYFNGDKIIIYQMKPINEDKKKKELEDCIISFD